MMKKLFPLLLLLLVVSGSLTSGQTVEQKDPYVEGESFTYEGKYKRFGFAFSIAEIKFDVSKLSETGHYFIKSEARSKGTLTSLFNFKFYQRYESTIDGKELQILKTFKHDEQGDRVRDSEAEFNYQTKKVIYIENDPKDPSRPPRRVASSIGVDTQDIISAIYMLRGKDLAVGKNFVFKVSDSGLVYDVPVRVTARERKKSILGKKWCWRVDAEIFGEGRIIEQKGGLTIWITDDEQRVPIRAELETKLGDVRIKIKRYQTKKESLEDDGKDDDEEDKKN